jgi:hypothetical protein
MTPGGWVVVVGMALAASDASLAKASGLFDAGDFEGALKSVEAALSHEPSPAGRAQLQVLRGRCFAALHKPLEVDAALDAALEEDATVSLDGLDVSPTFTATLAAARTRLAGTLEVVTEPAGVGVRIDQVLVGRAPVSQRLSVGRHEVALLDGQGVVTATRAVVVTPRARQSLVLQVPAPAVAVGPAQHSPPPTGAGAGAGLPFAPGAGGRAVIDFAHGASAEAGVSLAGRYWLVEVDGVIGAVGGLGLRAGGRLPFWGDRLSAHLTADAVGFFGARFAPGGGATLGLAVHPWPFFEVFAEGSFRLVAAAPGFASRYALLGAGVRFSLPAAGR